MSGTIKGSVSDTGLLKGSISAILGKDGVDGYTPIKGKDYFDGKNGISATHSWDGTTLTVTSASGTSSADLKGDKGDVGVSPYVSVTEIEGGHRITVSDKEGTCSFDVIDGKPGRGINYATVGSDGRLTVTYTDGTQYISAQSLNGKNGANGTSVGVADVSTSTVDGGYNTVSFTDGKTMRVKNGDKGDKGDAFTYEDFTPEQLEYLKGVPGNPGVYIGSGDMPDGCNVQIDPDGKPLTPDDIKPQKGIDYWTNADKLEIVQYVVERIPVGDEVEY